MFDVFYFYFFLPHQRRGGGMGRAEGGCIRLRHVGKGHKGQFVMFTRVFFFNGGIFFFF